MRMIFLMDEWWSLYKGYIMRFVLLLLLALTLGCSPKATYKPGNYVRDKINGKPYMILYEKSYSFAIQYECRRLYEDSTYTDSKFEVELEPYIPPDPKAEKEK